MKSGWIPSSNFLQLLQEEHAKALSLQFKDLAKKIADSFNGEE